MKLTPPDTGDDLDDELLDEQQLEAKQARALVLAEAAAWYGFGGEIVPFLGFGGAKSDVHSKTPQPLDLMGPVEEYLNIILMAQEATLRRRLTQSAARYPSVTKLEWLMATQTIIGYGVGRDGRPTDGTAGKQAEGGKEGGKSGGGSGAGGASGADNASAATSASSLVPVDPFQVSMFVAALFNTRGAEVAMRSYASGEESAFEKAETQHAHDVSELAKLIRSNLSPLHRRRVGAVMVSDLHHRDFLSLLRSRLITDRGCFEWQSCLRAEYDAPGSSGGDDGGDLSPLSPSVLMVGALAAATAALDQEPKGRAQYVCCGARLNYAFQYVSPEGGAGSSGAAVSWSVLRWRWIDRSVGDGKKSACYILYIYL